MFLIGTQTSSCKFAKPIMKIELNITFIKNLPQNLYNAMYRGAAEKG